MDCHHLLTVSNRSFSYLRQKKKINTANARTGAICAVQTCRYLSLLTVVVVPTFLVNGGWPAAPCDMIVTLADA